MPSAPRLAGQPSVPRGPRHADLGASRQLSTRLPTPTARLPQDAGGFRFRLVPDLRLRKILRLVNGFAVRAVPMPAQRGFAFGVFPRRQDLRSALLSPISPHPSKTVHQTKNFAEKANVRPNRHRPTSSLLRATSSRKATAFRARRAQNGRAIRVQRRELGSGRTNVVAPRSTLLLPNRYPRLVCALALQNDPPDFWRRGGQKGRSRALGQRFARMPP